MTGMVLLLLWPLAGALVVAVPLAYYGVFLVERRMVFVSVSLAQAAMAGAAAASFLRADLRLGALFGTTGLVLLLVLRSRSEAHLFPDDSLLGFLYVVGGGMAVVLLAVSPGSGLDETALLFGTLLGIAPADVALLSAAAAVSGALALFLHPRYLFVAFDTETAQILGERVTLVEAAFFGSLGLVVSVAIRMTGVLLTFALLLLPALAMRSLSRKSLPVFVGASLLAVSGVFAGLLLSARLDWPTGACISLVLAGTVVLSAAVGKLRALGR